MADRQLLDDQRLAFGRVADLYDRARPSYPHAVVDELLDFAKLRPPATILEVGAGTGKATVLLAERGFAVLGLEPSHEMASLARAKCAQYPGVEIIETGFERWHPREQLPALVCAGAWHWISPALRYQLAYAALVPGGTLAAIWTFPDWKRCPLRAALSDASSESGAGTGSGLSDASRQPADEARGRLALRDQQLRRLHGTAREDAHVEPAIRKR